MTTEECVTKALLKKYRVGYVDGVNNFLEEIIGRIHPGRIEHDICNMFKNIVYTGFAEAIKRKK